VATSVQGKTEAALTELRRVVSRQADQIRREQAGRKAAERREHAAQAKSDAFAGGYASSQEELQKMGGSCWEMREQHGKLLQSISVEGKRHVHLQLLAHYRAAMDDLAEEASEVEEQGDVGRTKKRVYTKSVHSVAGMPPGQPQASPRNCNRRRTRTEGEALQTPKNIPPLLILLTQLIKLA
jgi:hypothetical protein